MSVEVIERFDLLLERVVAIKFFMRLSDESAKHVLKQLYSQKSQIEKLNEEQSNLYGHTYDSFYFRNPYTGELRAIKSKKTSISERIDAVQISKNRQYQWVLSDAYELFEDFFVEYTKCAVQRMRVLGLGMMMEHSVASS